MSVSYLFEHEVAIFVRTEFNAEHSADVIWDDETWFFVLNLISVFHLQYAYLLIYLVVLWNLQFI